MIRLWIMDYALDCKYCTTLRFNACLGATWTEQHHTLILEGVELVIE